MAADTLFNDGAAPVDDFKFNARVAEVFDDMLGRSIPFYNEIIGMTAQLLARFLTPGGRVYDLGCSTGSSLMELARQLAHLDLQFIGIDNSAAMIKKARLKAEMYGKGDTLRFECADIMNLNLHSPAAVIMNYTLQFIRPMMRLDFIRALYAIMPPGAVLIVSEKSINHDPLFNRAFLQFYLDFKRRQGYSEIEIAKKREALENILIPFSNQENVELLRRAGFRHIETFFQWFNFSSFIALKE
ncbi:tRNA (cmo5U34)-methyltransferase [hydrothermal vent metagenome]|uniref:tRNA (Cmo5U34)-methyltransferase n=1 Tax=hydrothermal vent metagenome TaxID=652676 RepID=A0A3B0UUY0_9ZZZZ